MKSFKSWLYEKRRNPEQNPRVSSYEQIKPYLKDGYYISMRNINKLGINPESKYKTPNGIYSYHLGVYKDKIEQGESLRDLPYVSDAPYVYLFKSKIKPIKLGDMTEESVKKFIKDVFDKKPELKTFFLENVDYLKSLERTIGILKKDRIEELKYGDDHTFNDKDVEFLKTEFTNTFKVEPKKYKHEEYLKLIDDTIKELEIELRELKGNINNPKFLIDKIYNEGKQEALVKTPGGIFWWFSWFIYQRRMNKWNGFFREMGIYGVDDNKGESIIHPNEPFQTVFFDKTQLEVIKVFDNKDYIRYKKEQENKIKSFIVINNNKIYYEMIAGIRVYSNIDIGYMNLKKLPNFGDNYIVTGNFDCHRNQLTSLEGSPSSVGGDFDCSYNKLTSLEGSPNSVGGDFYCSYNKLTTLEDSPNSVNGGFYCSYNKLTSLEGSPNSVGGDFDCHRNQLTSLEGSPSSVGGGFSCYYNKKKFTKEEVREVSDVKGNIYV